MTLKATLSYVKMLGNAITGVNIWPAYLFWSRQFSKWLCIATDTGYCCFSSLESRGNQDPITASTFQDRHSIPYVFLGIKSFFSLPACHFWCTGACLVLKMTEKVLGRNEIYWRKFETMDVRTKGDSWGLGWEARQQGDVMFVTELQG